MTQKKRKAVLLNDTRVDRHHGSFTVIETIYSIAAENQIDIVASAPAHLDWRKNTAVCRAIDAADLVIVNGEGTIHHNRPAGAWLLTAGEYAGARGKRAVLINATWQANGQQFVELAKRFSIVSVRESASAAELGAAGIACQVVPDLAMYHQPKATALRRGVGYTDCVVGPSALGLYRRMGALDGEPVSMFYHRRAPRDFLVSARRFLPGRRPFSPSNIIAALRGAITDITAQISDRDAFTAKVATKRLIVTGRFHMLIFALVTRTPFLVIASNTHKNQATLGDTGLGTWRFVTVDQISRRLIDRAAAWDAGECECLDSFIAQSRQRMRALFAGMSALVG